MNKITKIKESDLQPKIKKKILQRLQHLWALFILMKAYKVARIIQWLFVTIKIKYN
jgi:hypothetical protein